jgi:hypothetical protein
MRPIRLKQDGEAMDATSRVFDRMDEWRHLPSYQLERRADLFFSLCLPDALQRRSGVPISDVVIPEFPVRIGTINPGVSTNKSYKIDYVAFARDLTKAIFVELKTDRGSRRPEQDRYLCAARDAGMPALLGGLVEIFQATESKRKYFRLLSLLARIGLLRIPEEMRAVIGSDSLVGINELARRIEITCPVRSCEIVYLQPNGDPPDVMNFDEFTRSVLAYGDDFSRRFARSLMEWSRVEAGTARPLKSPNNEREGI